MQYRNYSIYANITDEEWVEKLLYQPPIQPLHYYFFKVKCHSFLKYIAEKVLEVECVESILGEFYEFLSRDNWHVLRNYKKRDNASLSTYLSRCTLHHFLRKKEKAKPLCSLDSEEIIEQLNNLTTNDEEKKEAPVWKAFARLCERDQKVLQRLIIEGRTTTEIADEMWTYVKSKEQNWRNLPIKRVQDTIAMMKRRALFLLVEEIRQQPS